MDSYKKLRQASIHNNKMREDQKQKYVDRSTARLSRSIEKKIRTTFIGAISEFENTFGYLWGHGLPEEKLTENHKKFRIVWEEVRTTILNKGNNQLRAARSEIEEYNITWNRHHTNIPIVEDNFNDK